MNSSRKTAVWILLLPFFLSVLTPCALALESSPQVLTNAAQLRALSAKEAELRVPVRLRAVVTTVDPLHSTFIQDETGGTYITPRPNRLVAGDVIEVEGVSHPGFFLPGIRSKKITKLHPGELPAPVPVTIDDLLSTRWHYHRVEVSGVVRSASPIPIQDRFTLQLAIGPRKLEVQIIVPGITNLPPLVNAKVRIAGLAAGYLNAKRQLIAPHLIVSQLEDIRIEAYPPADPFDLPLRSFSSLFNFDPSGVISHRVRISGVVTHQQPGEALFLRDDEGNGLLVQTTQPGTVLPGDIVEAVGFTTMGPFSAYLEDAEFRKIGRGAVPEAIPTTVPEALEGTNDADLVSITGELLEILNTPADTILVLHADGTMLRARVPQLSLPLRNGSLLRLTGVCLVQESSFASPAFLANPRTVQLSLRSSEDIEVLSMPPWWTTGRLTAAISILLGLGLAGLFWIFMLRHRLREQAEVIREKVQREATLEERHRVAREMHDTLAQSFSGLGFQLDAIHVGLPADAHVARNRLETARQIVRHNQEDFRRSLMNLRAQELERGGLAEALPEFARNITAGTGIEVISDIRCPVQSLRESVENNLLRIGQECLTNAVRHGRPKRISLSLTCEEGVAQLRIADDGTGFNPEQLQHTEDGHFGWQGIQERTEQIRGKLELKSEPGRGTTVIVTVPV